MKKYLLLFFLIYSTSNLLAFDWSTDEYIENCSVIYQKKIADSDREIVGYCMGVLKGTITGIVLTRSIETGKTKTPMCMLSNGNMKFWEIQKNVLAQMRLKFKNIKSSNLPNTANAAVVAALIELYPCLLD